ncbi:MAG: DUF2970 domain-containing protein [Thiogranum sp.]|nr:DUF2970 domain-containing protein [Thiogranum sp.]
MSQRGDSQQQQGQSLITVIRSVAASMFGVQSSKQHSEDFHHGKASTYIAVGLIATILFVLTIWGVVQLVVRLAQPS